MRLLWCLFGDGDLRAKMISCLCYIVQMIVCGVKNNVFFLAKVVISLCSSYKSEVVECHQLPLLRCVWKNNQCKTKINPQPGPTGDKLLTIFFWEVFQRGFHLSLRGKR